MFFVVWNSDPGKSVNKTDFARKRHVSRYGNLFSSNLLRYHSCLRAFYVVATLHVARSSGTSSVNERNSFRDQLNSLVYSTLSVFLCTFCSACAD